MSAHDAVSDEILNQAGEWLLELQSADVPVERIAAWQQWLGSNELHARAFDQLQLTWDLADRLAECNRRTLPWPSAADLDQAPPRLDVVADRGRDAPRRTFSEDAERMRRFSLAATVFFAAVGLAFWFSQERAALVVETAIGDHRDVRLADGSVVSVGADSRLRVTMESDRRRVELERGEAYFEVAKDPLRPFSVHAGSASVTAIGTAFNVRRTREHVVVGVSEGTVAVAPAHDSLLGRIGLDRRQSARLSASTRISAGQQLVLEPDPVTTPQIEAIEPPAVASWREGRLRYSGEPLDSVIADVNRYVDEPIVISDRSIATLRVTGTVSEANIESWLTSLQTSLPVEIAKENGRIEVRRRR